MRYVHWRGHTVPGPLRPAMASSVPNTAASSGVRLTDVRAATANPNPLPTRRSRAIVSYARNTVRLAQYGDRRTRAEALAHSDDGVEVAAHLAHREPCEHHQQRLGQTRHFDGLQVAENGRRADRQQLQRL